MSKKDFNKLFTVAKTFVTNHSPEILTGIGITGMCTATVLAVKATPKALKKIEEKKVDVYEEMDACDIPSNALPEDVTLTKAEIIKATWKCYIPAAVTTGVSVACLVGASKVNLKRNAALATAYNLSQTALTEYKKVIDETVDEEKVKEIKEKVAQEAVNKKPVDEQRMANNKEIIMTDGESFRCYDMTEGRYFWSNKESIREAVNNINARLLSYDYVSLNEFYDELELKNTKMGDKVGWNMGRDGLLSVHFSSVLDDKGRPCLAIEYNVEPRYDYSDMR